MVEGIHHHIKVELGLFGHSMRDLAQEYPASYQWIFRIINGYQPAPADFEEKCRIIFAKWNSEQAPAVNPEAEHEHHYP
jgi:hypothetical protein